ncbi:unnamed protein product [Heligmosomoides polygyrus]|uniref:RecQ_Zn_bind domain-containing protein n=1 Tax=Heligmosomoides polygyrus TaxID=6339 RepID=A0A183GDR6_HELPZ|nr:unnamed protein product [Heligmosomoides polygyrus]
MSSDRSITTPELNEAMELLASDDAAISAVLKAVKELNKSVQLISSRLHYLQTAMDTVLDRTDVVLTRTAPKSNCIFCTVEENRDSHHSCMKYADLVSRTVQALRLNLCLKCLKPSHGGDCQFVIFNKPHLTPIQRQAVFIVNELNIAPIQHQAVFIVNELNIEPIFFKPSP